LIEPWTDIQKQAGIEKVRDLPTIPLITRTEGDPDMAAIRDLHADVIIDYGAIDEHYVKLADKIQSATGIPYLVFDGRLIPEIGGRPPSTRDDPALRLSRWAIRATCPSKSARTARPSQFNRPRPFAFPAQIISGELSDRPGTSPSIGQ
jgi:hypothetical protein